MNIPESVQTYLALTLEEDRTGEDLTADVWELVRAESRLVTDWVDVCRLWADSRESDDNRLEMLALMRIAADIDSDDDGDDY